MKEFSKTLLIVLTSFILLALSIFWPIFLGKVNLNGNLLVSFYAPYGQNLPFKNTGWDQLRIYFPFYRFTFGELRRGKFPLWNPYAFSGHPHLADFQTAVFYPLNIFGLILSQIEFWHLLRIIPSILAALFTFLYLENLPAGKAGLKLSKLASLFGAVTFGFSPLIITWGEEVVMSPHSIIWLPLILFSVDRFLKSNQKKFLALIAFSVAFSLFGGYIQTTIYMLIFIFSYLVFRLWPKKNWFSAKALKIYAVFVLGILISSVQLLPSSELYFNSARAAITLREKLFEFLLPPQTLLTYLAPDLFGHPATANFIRDGSAQYYEGILFVGVAALVFALLAIFAKERQREVTFLSIFGLIAVTTTFDLSTSRLFLSVPIPFLSSSIANRVLFIPAFCLATLAAFGINQWLTSGDKRILKVIFFFGFAYMTLIIYLLGAKYLKWPYVKPPTLETWQAATISLRNLVIPLGVFGLSALLIWWTVSHRSVKNLAFWAIFALSIIHIFYFSQKYLSFTKRENVFPDSEILNFIRQNQGYFRSWGAGSAFFENNFASFYGLFWPEGYDSLNNRSYSEFTYAMQGNRIEAYVFRADAGLGRGETAELLGSSARRRLIDMVGVKFLIAKKEDEAILTKNNFSKVFDPGGGDFAVFENKEVLSRAFLASNYEGPPDIIGGGETIENIQRKNKERRKLIPNKLLKADFDFRNVLILEEPSPISAQFGEGSAEILSYKPQEVIIKTKSDQPKLLFLSDNYYPGWKAEVDGDETKIWRANYTFRAVPLTRGEHTVRFYYESQIFKIGLLVSVVSLGALIAFLLGSNWRLPWRF